MLNRGLLLAGCCYNGTDAGSWCRYGYNLWDAGVNSVASFRAAAYAQ